MFTESFAARSIIHTRKIVVGPEFYNSVLMPVGLVLLTTLALAPLLRWGRGPTTEQKRCLAVSIAVSVLIVIAAKFVSGVDRPFGLAVAGLVSLAVCSLLTSVWLDAQQRIQRGQTVKPF